MDVRLLNQFISPATTLECDLPEPLDLKTKLFDKLAIDRVDIHR